MSPQFIPTRRTSLMVQTGAEWHLFFVLTDPVGDPPAVLIANASSIPSNKYVPYDKSCLLGPKDHPFFAHPSYIAYRFSDVVLVSKVAQQVRTGDMKVKGALTEECCARICEGLMKSASVPLKCKRFYEAASRG